MNLKIPKRISVETIFGCNASCIMCPIDLPTERKKGIMDMATSNKIFEEFAPYVDQIEKVDLFGLGEPLLDPHLVKRIKYAKGLGFKNLAISTNAQRLTEQKQLELLDSEIETIIFSIDGFNAETHQEIRRKLDYHIVIKNCESMIRKRDEGGYKTRFVMRFIRQEKNWHEWEPYFKKWDALLSGDKRDIISRFDAHSWSGALATKQEHLGRSRLDPLIEGLPCWHVFEHFVVLADGTVPLCSEDWHKGTVRFGNVKDENAVEIFNNRHFEQIRGVHSRHSKNQMKLCQDCTVHYSFQTKSEFMPSQAAKVA